MDLQLRTVALWWVERERERERERAEILQEEDIRASIIKAEKWSSSSIILVGNKVLRNSV